MEDRDRPAALTMPPASRSAKAPAAPPATESGPGHPGGWIVSPAFDLLLVANLGWPLLLLPGLSGRNETAVDFWQVYFVTLPHRWITLVLVALDPDRRERRGVRLVAIAAAMMALVAGVWLGTAAFTCLAVVDYVWNAWHFAAQHAGVLRIYGRKVGGGPAWMERYGIRFFVTYAVLRTAGWTTGWLETSDSSRDVLRAVDLLALAVPTTLAVAALCGVTRARAGKTVYTLSVCALYGGLLLSLSNRASAWVVPLATASGLFHATEYLAVVTHYARRRRNVGAGGPSDGSRACGSVPGHLRGGAGVDGGLAGGGPAFEFWLGLNLWAAAVHYAFDGMIWKLRRPETARALGGVPVIAGRGPSR
ncbi:MAG: hypothetical protein WKF75_15140 [Singulisphaera sp.]